MINYITKSYFDKNEYIFIHKFLDKHICELLYNYSITQVKSVDFKMLYEKNKFDTDWDGNFGDGQVSSSYYRYGDPIMDTLLLLNLNKMENFLGKKLVPTYTYWRFYEKGNILERHKDRESCEISATLCLGYNYSNLEKKYFWPIELETKEGENISIEMEPGDALIYKGCLLNHWRNELLGLNHTQVFLHYNDEKGLYNIKYDGRSMIGVPKKFNK